MPASDALVRLDIRELVEQQQIADQEGWYQRSHEGCPAEGTRQGEVSAHNHQNAESQSGGDQAHDRAADPPVGVGDQQEQSKNADWQQLPTLKQDEVDADGGCDCQ